MVGLKAYNALLNDEDNVAVEFKRLMGTTFKKHFPSTGVSLSSEELSAEILKSIRQDVERLTNERMINAVITVPAAFGTLQCGSTYRAAELAGFKSIHLLQEPIAAAIAYGAKPGSKEKNWMVFDLGGGTFDVAIVSTINDRLTVLKNEGNNLLGGKDIDRLIVEKIFLPIIKEEYNLFKSNSEEYHKFFRKLLFKAEEVKVELSSLKAVNVFFDGIEIGHDADGKEINLEIKVTRGELDNLLEDIINETIQLAQKALDSSNISELDKIVLVGGSTQIPSIRNALRDHFNVEVDFSLDPITVVARGAALYASVTSAEQNKGNAVATPSDVLSVRLEYEPFTTKLNTVVAGRFFGKGELHEICISSTDGFWTSGWLPLKDKDNNFFEVEVRLRVNSTNEYILQGRDALGNILAIEGSSFSIKHNEEYIPIAKPLIPYSLCVEYIDKSGNRKLLPLIPKGTSLPAFASYDFKTTKELRPSRINDFITVKFWEGEYFDEPEANIWMGNLYIRSSDISRPLHKGAEVTISLYVDESRQITFEAYFPAYNYKFSGTAIYKPTPLDLEERFGQLKEDIGEYFERLKYIAEKIPYNDENKRSLYDRLYEEVEDYSIEYHEAIDSARLDKDKAQKIIEKSKSIRVKLLNLERDLIGEKQVVNLEKEAIQTLKRVDYIVDSYGSSAEKNELEKLKSELQYTLEFCDSRGVKHVINKASEMEWGVIVNRIDFWRDLFYYYSEEENIKYIDPIKAEKWIARGRKADRDNDLDSLRESVLNLIKLLKKDIRQAIQESVFPPDLQK
jgi:molecular chaperone DnaK